MSAQSTSAVSLACMALTVLAYAFSRWAGARVRSPFTTPVFLSTALIVAALMSCGLGAQDYEPARQVLTLLLAPATVALAFPLHRHLQVLRRHLRAGAAGIAAGVVVTVLCAVLTARMVGLPEALVRASSAKSVTVAVAVQIAPLVRADAALVAGLVIATGMLGAMFGPCLMRWARIDDPVARGLALGTIAHGQGTAQATVEGELPGAVAALAMGMTAIFSSLAVPAIMAAVG